MRSAPRRMRQRSSPRNHQEGLPHDVRHLHRRPIRTAPASAPTAAAPTSIAPSPASVTPTPDACCAAAAASVFAVLRGGQRVRAGRRVGRPVGPRGDRTYLRCCAWRRRGMAAIPTIATSLEGEAKIGEVRNRTSRATRQRSFGRRRRASSPRQRCTGLRSWRSSGCHASRVRRTGLKS